MAMRRIAVALSLGGLLAMAPLAPGQDEPPRFAVSSDLVHLPTRVQDKKGGTIYGLQASQFIVEDNGVRQEVTVDETPDFMGISMVVVLQCSRTAPAEFPKLKGLATMIDAIAGGVSRDIAVLGYGEGPHLLGDFSRNPKDTRRAVAKLQPCGDYSAATIDAVSYAIGMLNRHKSTGRHAILLVSETRDHGSRAKLDEVARELGVSDTVIYTVAFAPARHEAAGGSHNSAQQRFMPQSSTPERDSKPEPPEPEHAPLLELPPQIMAIVNALRTDASATIASLSGGEHFTFKSQKSFDESLLKISNRIHNYYLLSFRPPAGMPGVHTLRVRVDGHPEAVIQTRRNYLAGISADQ